MIELMNFIDYMFDPVHTLDGKKTYDIFLKNGLWQILDGDKMVTMSNDPEHILMYMDKLKLNMVEMDSYLRCHVATIATVHLQTVDRCRKLVGQELIDETYAAWKDFGKELGKAIQKTQLKVVKNENI